jgi:hypothetical protein
MQVNLVKKYMPFDQSGVHLLINVSEGVEREALQKLRNLILQAPAGDVVY